MSIPADDHAEAIASAIGDSALEAAASRVYLSVLRVPRPSRALLIAQGIPAGVLDPALALLAQRGLVRPGPTGEIDVPPPLTAMPQLASDLERRAAVVRATAHDLTQVFFNARARRRDPDSGITLLHDLDEVASQTNVLVAGGLEQICVVRATSARTQQLLAAPLESQREPTVGLDSQPLRHRTIWDTDVLDEEGADEVMRARRAGGEEQRFFLRVPFSLVLVDDSVCLVEWTGAESDAPEGADDAPVGVVLHTPGLVGGVRRLFERLWELSSPVDRGSVTDEVDRRDLTILRLLAAGVADASIARQTGVSQRTVERRIRSLLDRLGAGTRFQAGAQAVRRGWL
ncbi:helix-turn-helix domain-containing protein [Lapillicoccus jejuensis]|uniref:Regulatory LuxR family protein n=1 Tax=Lapillicoccus jejuensis TaxID=402171 RepID=A0A542E067_9MICO|nr:helix-turn-helix transcriptional regulator [Lapillicoccus jejuensis]TQJ08747.1 regulatory LuxR family protein [Lapillicoccus jejuensis]